MKELEKDMAILRNGMKEVGRELEFFRTQPPTNGDRYSSDMITSIVKNYYMITVNYLVKVD